MKLRNEAQLSSQARWICDQAFPCLLGSTTDEFPSRVTIANCPQLLIWRTIPVTPFAIYQKSTEVIEPEMNIVTYITREEYIFEFKSRKLCMAVSFTLADLKFLVQQF